MLGAINLEGLRVEDTVEKDLEILGPYFADVRRSDDVPPLCDVLLLYGEINSSGALQNSPKPANEIVRDAGASIVISLGNWNWTHHSRLVSRRRMVDDDRKFCTLGRAPGYASGAVDHAARCTCWHLYCLGDTSLS